MVEISRALYRASTGVGSFLYLEMSRSDIVRMSFSPSHGFSPCVLFFSQPQLQGGTISQTVTRFFHGAVSFIQRMTRFITVRFFSVIHNHGAGRQTNTARIPAWIYHGALSNLNRTRRTSREGAASVSRVKRADGSKAFLEHSQSDLHLSTNAYTRHPLCLAVSVFL